jgi:uncharacterized protein (TIGR02452 family)
MIQMHQNVLVLNMANHYTPGGGVDYGSFSQEEDLFRRSNYFRTLDKSLYPIESLCAIYSPGVTVFRDSDYQQLSNPFTVSLIAVAALFKPPKTPDERFCHKFDYDFTYKKIELIFQTASQLKYRVLILSALGCGAFHNPVNDIINIFNSLLSKYARFFDQITFAVRSHKDKNYELFRDGISFLAQA